MTRRRRFWDAALGLIVASVLVGTLAQPAFAAEPAPSSEIGELPEDSPKAIDPRGGELVPTDLSDPPVRCNELRGLSMFNLESLATAWWENRRTGGYIDSMGTAAESDPVADLVEDVVDALVRNPSTFDRVLVALVRSAPSRDDLSYLGTRIVEDAEMAFGSRALVYAQAAGLSEEELGAVLLGYEPRLRE